MRDMTLTEAERLRLETADAIAFEMDEEAFRAFYDRTARPLWAYLSRLTGDRQAADDLLQEAYYRFLRARAQHEDDHHRRNSLFRIATNLARDRHRRLAGVQNVSLDDHELQSEANAVSRVERRADLHRAMQQLKPRERELLWLAYAQGSSHREIAASVGVKTGSVKPLLFRARRKLADLLRGARAHRSVTEEIEP
jgi:RNA polymerase sigma-70 factor (ECF subfamily)